LLAQLPGGPFGGLAALSLLVEGVTMFGGGAFGLPAAVFGVGDPGVGGVDVTAGPLPGGLLAFQSGVPRLQRLLAQLPGPGSLRLGLGCAAFRGQLGGLGGHPGVVGLLGMRDRGLLDGLQPGGERGDRFQDRLKGGEEGVAVGAQRGDDLTEPGARQGIAFPLGEVAAGGAGLVGGVAAEPDRPAGRPSGSAAPDARNARRAGSGVETELVRASN
jgi:hypothetical protein